jgi:eukaryotic-like serine/threonine-protein kinase
MNLELGRIWKIGEQIGRGGFGQVYVATADGEEAVVKLVPKDPGAQREMLFEDLADARNIVPIIDRGETEDYWVIVMPRAARSLRQHLDEATGPLDIPEAITILSDIATALVDLEGRVVHRDLKPENVLLLNGHWCLADFGIARYAEATTAPDTRKFAMSVAYAAPERWRTEPATIATDVYAVGIIAFELLAGHKPFPGPRPEDYREQHLHATPPNLDQAPPLLASLIQECLYKPPGARPNPRNLLARLNRLAKSAAPSSGLARLQEANRAEVSRLGEAARRDLEARSDSESRAALVDAALTSFQTISAMLKEAIRDAAPAVRQTDGPYGMWRLRLNDAELNLEPLVATQPSPWGSSDAPAFNVIAHSSLSLRIPPDRFEYEGRSHSLWYCDAQEQDQYQWYETAFMGTAFYKLAGKRSRQDPFALNPGEEAAKAVWTGIAEYQVAWPFSVVSPGDLDDFIDRWASWFADASQGRLQHPSSMPERSPTESWRRR